MADIKRYDLSMTDYVQVGNDFHRPTEEDERSTKNLSVFGTLKHGITGEMTRYYVLIFRLMSILDLGEGWHDFHLNPE